MAIDQRNLGANTTPVGDGYFVDRFRTVFNGSTKFSTGQNLNSVTPPAGFINYAGLRVNSAGSLASGDYNTLAHYIEGTNISDLDWGKSTAKTVTLSFQIYSNITGTFGGAISNSAYNRSYPFTYTISAANTWTSVTVTIPGDTSGTWLTTNGVGIRVIWSLGTGTTYSGTAGAWAGSTFYSATGATTIMAAANNVFYITGIQLEKGSQATAFDWRPYGAELTLCSRYFWRNYNAGYQAFYNRVYWNSSGNNLIFTLPVPAMRSASATTITCTPTTNQTSVSFSAAPFAGIYVYGVSASGDNYMYSEDLSVSSEL
jgi:hypothetical protein